MKSKLPCLLVLCVILEAGAKLAASKEWDGQDPDLYSVVAGPPDHQIVYGKLSFHVPADGAYTTIATNLSCATIVIERWGKDTAALEICSKKKVHDFKIAMDIKTAYEQPELQPRAKITAHQLLDVSTRPEKLLQLQASKPVSLKSYQVATLEKLVILDSPVTNLDLDLNTNVSILQPVLLGPLSEEDLNSGVIRDAKQPNKLWQRCTANVMPAGCLAIALVLGGAILVQRQKQALSLKQSETQEEKASKSLAPVSPSNPSQSSSDDSLSALSNSSSEESLPEVLPREDHPRQYHNAHSQRLSERIKKAVSVREETTAMWAQIEDKYRI